MRLIDADELDKTIREEFHGISATGFICFMRDKTPIEVYNRVRDLIDSAPTVEPYQDKERVTIEMSEEEIEKFRQMLIDIFKDILKEAKNETN